MMTKRKLTFLTISVVLMVTLLAGAMFGQATQKSNVYRYLSMFSEVFDLVRSNYVEPVATNALMEGAFTGVTDAIDEFSYYVPPAQMAAYKSFHDVEDNGLGMIVTKRFGVAYVVATVAGSPAEKAGIERGDFLEQVGNQPTQKLSVWQIRSMLHSQSPISVKLLRAGSAKRMTVNVTPASFHPVKLETKSFDGVAYIRIPYFEKGTAAEFKAALEDVRKRGVEKLIVDVRGNAGGSMEEAIVAADELLTSGMITSVLGRKIERKTWQADRPTSFDGQVQVLTDISTAAGAEVFASAIRGNGRGKVVGLTTYGKAIVQRFIPLPSGGGVQMTVAHYTTPESKPILETGLKPDVVVDTTAAELARAEGDMTPEQDVILERALELFGVETPTDVKKAA